MTGFRVTKYNPELRDVDGAYRRLEWTSASDIGRSSGGAALEYNEYLAVESAYVEAVHRFLDAQGISALRVSDLEVHDNCDALPALMANETQLWVSAISEGLFVASDALDCVIRLTLREAIWCRLEGPNGFYVHFGYDYYMYIGWESSEGSSPTMPAGIYAELFASPYAIDEPITFDSTDR